MNKKIFVMVLLFLAAYVFAEDNDFSFSASRTEAVLAEGKEHTVLTGNAIITTKNKEIKADRIDIYGEDFEIVVCSGNIVVEDAKNDTTLKCQSLEYNRDTEVITVKGYSEMEDRKNELVTKSGYIEENSKEKFSILQISVRILKISDGEAMSCRSEYAEYDRNAKILKLTGLPRVTWKGDVYEGSRITVDLDTDEIELEGNVSGSITTEEKEEQEQEEKNE